MAPFRLGDVVVVPFPYTDRSTRQRRPALVLSSDLLTAEHGLVWVLMITSAENRPWSGDVPLNFAEAGLPAPSVVRTAKIATIEAGDAELLGRITEAEIAQVRREVEALLVG